MEIKTPTKIPDPESASFSEWLEEVDARTLELLGSDGSTYNWDPSGIPKAKNIIDWIRNPQFLGRDTLYEYPRQYQILRDIYELLCPHCNDMSKCIDCWDRSVWDMQHDVLLEYGVCPKCGRTRYDLMDEGFIENIDEVILILGGRSGKTTMIGTFDQTYLAHIYLTIKDPIKYFHLDRSVMLEAGFFAASREQAEQTIWAYFISTLLATSWYTNYVESIKEFAETQKLPFDKLYYQAKTQIHIPVQHVRFMSYHSNPATTAGRTRFSAVIDEMGMFLHTTGDSIHAIPRSSLQTLLAATEEIRARRTDPDVPPVRITEIGTPGPDPAYDPLERRYRVTTTHPIPRVYALRLPTWRANKKITRESLENEFLTDPVKAQQLYGAEAIPTGVRFFPPGVLGSCFVPNESPGILWSPNSRCVDTQDGNRIYYSEVVLEQIRLQPSDGPLVVVGDAGLLKDRFALAIGRKIGSGTDHTARIETIISIIPQFISTPTGGVTTEVYYPCVLDLLKQIHRRCPISMAIFDRWDSTYILQELRNIGIPATRKNIRPEDYTLARGEFRSGRVRIPSKCPPYMSQVYHDIREEAEELRQSPDGKIDHPPGGHNDTIQVVCQLVSILLSYQEVLTKIRKDIPKFSGTEMPKGRAYQSVVGRGQILGSPGRSGVVPGVLPESVSELMRRSAEIRKRSYRK